MRAQQHVSRGFRTARAASPAPLSPAAPRGWARRTTAIAPDGCRPTLERPASVQCGRGRRPPEIRSACRDCSTPAGALAASKARPGSTLRIRAGGASRSGRRAGQAERSAGRRSHGSLVGQTACTRRSSSATSRVRGARGSRLPPAGRGLAGPVRPGVRGVVQATGVACLPQEHVGASSALRSRRRKHRPRCWQPPSPVRPSSAAGWRHVRQVHAGERPTAVGDAPSRSSQELTGRPVERRIRVALDLESPRPARRR